MKKILIWTISILGFIFPFLASADTSSSSTVQLSGLYQIFRTGAESSSSTTKFEGQEILGIASSSVSIGSLVLELSSSTVDKIILAQGTNDRYIINFYDHNHAGGIGSMYYNGQRKINTEISQTVWTPCQHDSTTPHATNLICNNPTPIIFSASQAPFQFVFPHPSSDTRRIIYGNIADDYHNGNIIRSYSGGGNWAEDPGLDGGNLKDLYFILSAEIPIQNNFPDTTISKQAMLDEFNYRNINCYSTAILGIGIPDFGCEIRKAFSSAIEFLFGSTNTDTTPISNAIDNFKTVFPFNIFFTFSDSLSSSTSNYVLSDNSLVITLPTSTPGTITINSSTLNTFLGASNWTLIRQYETNIIYIMLLAGIIMIVLL